MRPNTLTSPRRLRREGAIRVGADARTLGSRVPWSGPLRPRRVGALAITAVAALSVTASADAAVFTVTNTADTGAGSLRQAIEDANLTGARDAIEFDIPGAVPHVIQPVNDLPAITAPIDVRGYTEPDADPADAVLPAEIVVVIDAQNATNGLVLETNDSKVRGIAVQSASGAAPAGAGIRVKGDRNRLEGNYVGLDVTNFNSFLLGNAGDGIQIRGDDNVVGGVTPERRNVIAANGKPLPTTDADGVSIDGDGNAVQGNAIGTDPLMSAGGIGNSDAGVRLLGDSNLVGGSVAGAANVIAGNATAVQVDEGTGNEVLGNLIGTDALGGNPPSGALMGNSRGVVLDASGNRVGGRAARQTNVIANTLTGAGVVLNSDDNVVEGNRIGTDAAGALALPNLGGIAINGDRNMIGGAAVGAPNVVSGNAFYGIGVGADGSSGDRNHLRGNLVGMDAGGTTALANDGDGIAVFNGSDNTIGGDLATHGNVVAFNAGDGVAIESGAGNSVLLNSLFENEGLGIDLAQDGVTPNDTGDSDTGANELMNVPVLDAATTVAGVTTVDWRLDDGLPLTRMRIDFYANDACDASGGGEGKTPLGAVFVTTDEAGDAGGSTVMVTAAAVGQQVSATATLEGLVQSPEETSELSACMAVL